MYFVECGVPRILRATRTNTITKAKIRLEYSLKKQKNIIQKEEEMKFKKEKKHLVVEGAVTLLGNYKKIWGWRGQ